MKSKTNSILISILILLFIILVVVLLYTFAKKQDFLGKIINKQTDNLTQVNKNISEKIDSISEEVSKSNCVIGGCNGDTCYDPEINQVNSVCMPYPTMNCYKNAECKRQASGKCGWTQTPELLSCFASKTDINLYLSKGLETAFKNYRNGEISECIENGNIYYSAQANMYYAGGQTFDVNGNVVGTYQGFTGNYTGITPENCEKIYAVFPNIWGYPPINKYNLK